MTTVGAKKVVKTRTLPFSVSSTTAATHWYVTHKAGFSPTSTSDTDVTLSTMNAWSNTASISYTLPDADGEYTFYVFASNGTNIVKKTGPTLLLDRAGPVITKTSGPDDGAEMPVGTISVTFEMKVADAGLETTAASTLKYCTGANCASSWKTPDWVDPLHPV